MLPDDLKRATEFIAEAVANQARQKWIFIPVDKLKGKAQNAAFRLNSLGSLYYFTKVTLRKHRLVPHLHLPICQNLEKDYLKEVFEIPRDHFKSTICSESLPMWWALPFNDNDADLMRTLGYNEEFIRWMRRAHNPNTRTLVVSEVIENAIKLGSRISQHYENNDLFRGLFPEILPDTKCPWNAHSMTHKRILGATAQGEGTYDVTGVGGALQSRHYDRLIQDDLVGRKASSSDIVMEETIKYHQLLVGAFDADPTRAGQDNDELIVGNRWSYRDLNSWIREYEPHFNFINHSALGGCCDSHPNDTPIFPEEFTKEKLYKFKERLGSYLFSCQFLNSPTPPGDTFFKQEHLRYYEVDSIPTEDINKRRMILKHVVKGGEVLKDILPGNMQRALIVDPNHAENKGRCRHAVVVYGAVYNPFRIYILDVFAESCSYDKLCTKIYDLADKWYVKKIHLETIAAQRLLRFPLNYEGQRRGNVLKIEELKTDRSANAKGARIEALQPFLENGQFWTMRNGFETTFMSEYLSYPHGKTCDVIDVCGYIPQTLRHRTSLNEVSAFMQHNESVFESANMGQAGY